MRWQANGKLVLTAEYAVLHGATALALPVRFGQDMTVVEQGDPFLKWMSRSPDGIWFEAQFALPGLQVHGASDPVTAEILQRWLVTLRMLRPGFLTGAPGYAVTVTANYPLRWGLGSSATLISLLAHWAGVDPFQVHRLLSAGSGVDIACTRSDRLIRYRHDQGLSGFSEVSPGRGLTDFTWFAYLGRHLQTEREVTSFLSGAGIPGREILRLSALSDEILACDSGARLETLVREHEAILATLLDKEPVGSRFGDFPGSVKSLGAWGGDFAMFVSGADPATAEAFLHSRGLSPVFRFHDLAIKT